MRKRGRWAALFTPDVCVGVILHDNCRLFHIVVEHEQIISEKMGYVSAKKTVFAWVFLGSETVFHYLKIK